MKFKFIWKADAKTKSLSDQLIIYKHFSRYLMKIKLLKVHLMNLKSLLIRFLNLKSRSTRLGKLTIDNVRGRHVVIAGLLIYLLSFLIGLVSTGINLEDVDTPPDELDSQESSILKYSEVLGDIVCSKDSFINDLGSSVLKRSYDIPETTVPGKPDIEISRNCSEIVTVESMDNRSFSESCEMNVPVTLLKMIFLNNLGLNLIIIAGAFSLLAFSMIVLVFNAVQVGMLVKGIFNSYGLKLATVLVLPHLVVEVISHMISLYLAYLILCWTIVPVLVRGEGIRFNSFRTRYLLALFFLIVIITFVGALVEIYVTPKLI
jgi:uncharacterized membrane protein SpoIIM required for sporulation